MTSERTKAALSHKRKVQEVYSRITPLGFDRVGNKLVSNPAEMKTVQTILKLRTEGKSMAVIAEILNEAGTATKQGGKWYAVTIQKVLGRHSKAA